VSRLAALAAGIGLALVASAALAADTPLQVGPFTFGMSLDEARAAAPGLAWEDAERSPYSGRVLALAADNAVTLGGLPHQVTVRPGYHGGYELELETRPSVKLAAECDAAVLAVAAEAEPWIGKLTGVDATAQDSGSPPRSGLRWETRRGPDGNVSVVPVPDYAFSARPAPKGRVKVGKRSTVALVTRIDGVKAGDEPDQRVGEAEGSRGTLTLSVRSKFQREESGGYSCRVRTVLRRLSQTPAPRQVDVATLRFIAGDTIGLRHHSLDGLPVPSQPLGFEMPCQVRRETGILNCMPPHGRDAGAWGEALLRRTGALRLDPTRFDPDDPAQLRTTLSLAIRPEDRRPLDFLERPRVPVALLRWRYRPGLGTPAGFAGERVEVICEVQADQSLVCTDSARTVLSTETQKVRAVRFALRLVSGYVAEPQLADGRPSSGAVFSTVVEFGSDAGR
jgi:hypothetical protein